MISSSKSSSSTIAFIFGSKYKHAKHHNEANYSINSLHNVGLSMVSYFKQQSRVDPSNFVRVIVGNVLILRRVDI